MLQAARELQVLVVDDESLIRWAVVATLSEAGHTVMQASDGATAMRALAGTTSPFDVVLLDYRLPDSNDLQLLSRIRRHSPETAVVLMTAFATADVVKGALALGACHVINKPFDMNEIGRAVMAARAHQHSIRCGDHVCAILSSRDELAQLAASWIADGLRRRERCWYVASGSQTAIRAALAERHVDYDVEARRGAVNIVDASAAYVVDGVFDPARTIQIFSDTATLAVRDGFSGFRAAADMSWALDVEDGTERLVEYEALLKSMFASHRVTGLCLYHHGMPLEVLSAALATHPVAGSGGQYAPNPLYDPLVQSISDVRGAPDA